MKPQILVVDDSEIVLAMARDALEAGGFDVVTAASVMEAKPHIYGSRRPDLIVLDVMLPTIDGDKKARQLKEDPAMREIPILLISSKPEGELRLLTQESGADGFIRKPFTQETIVEKIRGALREKRAA